MKPEEALDNINNKILIQGRRNGKYLESEMMKVVIEALEKQVAKKPIEANEFTNDYVFDATICPTCDERVWAHYSHCPNCGQKIDWSEE